MAHVCVGVGLLVLTSLLFLAELGVAQHSNTSLVLADAFNHLHAAIGLVLVLINRKVLQSKPPGPHLTFGWSRAAVLGTFISNVFLCALMFLILIRSLKEIIDGRELVRESPLMLCATALASLCLTLLLLTIDGWPCSTKCDGDSSEKGGLRIREARGDTNESKPFIYSQNTGAPFCVRLRKHRAFPAIVRLMMPLLLLVLAALTWPDPSHDFCRYTDAGLAVIASVFRLLAATGIVEESGHILLQTVPYEVSLTQMRHSITSQLPEVLQIQKLHVWSLSNTCIVASMHVLLNDESQYPKIVFGIKRILHDFGVHSVTVQPNLADEAIPSRTELFKTPPPKSVGFYGETSGDSG